MFDLSVLFEIFSSWQVILVSVIVLVLFPVIFYLASFDKRPVKFKTVSVKKKPRSRVPAKPDERREDDEDLPRNTRRHDERETK